MRALLWLAAVLTAWAPAVHAEDVWEAMRAPGSVIVVRHAYSPGAFDPPDAFCPYTRPPATHATAAASASTHNTAAHRTFGDFMALSSSQKFFSYSRGLPGVH